MGKLRRAIASLSLVAILSTLVVTTSVAAASPTFTDVPATHWAYSAVEYLASADVAAVDSTKGVFNKDAAIQRDELVKMAMVASDRYAVGAADAGFKDLTGAWSKTYVDSAAAQGIVTKKDNFFPAANAQRDEALKIALESFGLDVLTGCKAVFPDVAATSWAFDYVNTAYLAGIVNGYGDGTFQAANNVSRAEFAIMLYKAKDAVVPEACPVMPPDGEPVDEEPVATGDVTVTVDESNPMGTTYGDGTAFNPVLSLRLQAGNKAATVKGLTVTKTGLALDSSISGVSAWVGTKRYGNIVTVSSNKATVSFASDPIEIPAGEYAVVDVKVNLDSAAGSGTMQWYVENEASVNAEGDVDGSFPLYGNSFGTIDGSTTVGSLTLDSETISTTTRNVDVGVVDQLISKFSFQGGANEDIWLHQVTFRNNGNTSDGDIVNLSFVDQLGADLAVIEAGSDDKTFTFDFSDDPLFIEKGTTKYYTIEGDVSKGSTRTFQALIDNDYDILAYGDATGSGILPVAGASDTSFPIGDRASSSTFNQITVREGSLTVSKDPSSPTGNVGVGAKGQLFGVWKLEAVGEDIEVRKIGFDLDSGAADSLATTTNITGTVKLVLNPGTANESAVFSIAATDADLYDDDTATATTDQFTLSSYFTIPAGETVTIGVVGDVYSSATSGLTMLAELGDLYYKKTSSNVLATAATTEIAANTLTSIAASVSLSSSTTMGAESIVAGGTSVKVGSFNLQSGAAEGISVQTIILDVTVGGETAITELSNLRLKKTDGTQIGATIASPEATDNSFSVSGELEIAKSENATIDVYADVSTSAATSTATGTVLTLVQAASDVTYVGSTSQTSSSTGISATNFQTVTVRSSGIIDVTPGAQVASGVMHSSESGREVFTFKLAATYEDINVDQILLETTNGGSNLKNLTLKDSAGAPIKTGGSVISDKITLSSLNITVPKDTVKTYSLYADSEKSGTLQSAEVLNIRLASVDATGKNSGQTITETSVISELGSTSSLGHYSAGDVIFESTSVAATVEPYFVVTTAAANEGVNLVTTGVTMAGSEAATAANTVAATERFAKLPGVLERCVISTSNCANNVADGDILYVYDASTTANTGFVIADTALASVNAADTLSTQGLGASGTDADIVLAANDIVVMFKTSLMSANITPNAANGAFAVGDVLAYHDADTAGNNGFYQVHTAIATDALNGAGTFDATGEADVSGVTLADTDDVTKINTVSAEEITTLGTTTATYEYRPGEIVFVSLGTDDAANGFEWVVVEEHVRAGTTWTASALSGNVTLASGSVITKVFEDTLIDSNAVTVHDVEPVVTRSTTALADGTGITGTLQEVARYNVKADGDRTMYVESIAVICSGSYVTNTEFTDNPMEVWVNGIRRFNDSENAADCSDTTAGSKGRNADFATPVEIASGTSVEFIFKYDTSATAGQASGESLVFKIDGVAGEIPAANDAVDWYYTAADPSPGTEPTEASPSTLSDSYPVTGLTLTY